MGKELDPGNPLFSGAAGVAAGVGLAALGSELDDLDLNLNSDLLEDDRESSMATPERQAPETEDALNDWI